MVAESNFPNAPGVAIHRRVDEILLLMLHPIHLSSGTVVARVAAVDRITPAINSHRSRVESKEVDMLLDEIIVTIGAHASGRGKHLEFPAAGRCLTRGILKV